MRRPYRLNVNNTVQVVDLDFQAVNVSVVNPTSSPVYVRFGSSDTPTSVNADMVIAAASSRTVPVKGGGYSFCLALGDASLLPLGARNALSGLLDEVEVTFLSVDEIVPTYGAYSFLSLSVSDLTNGPVAFAGATTSNSFDLTPWGGAVVFVVPGAGTGQGVVTVSASGNGTTWYTVQAVAFWPGVPLTLNVPRVMRFMRLEFNATAIPGEPAISGIYSVRASLEEITTATWSAGTGQITKTFSVASLGTSTYYFCTVGLRAVTVRAVFSSGSRGELIWSTSSSVASFGLVAYREQSVSGFYNSIFRSLGNLDSFLKIDVLEIANAGPMNGTLSLTIQAEPDLTGLLQQQFGALGDIGQPVNANQSIYHELDTMRGLDTTRNSLLSSGNSNTSSILSTVQSDRNDLRVSVTPITLTFNAPTATWQTVGGPVLAGGLAGGFIYSIQIHYGVFVSGGNPYAGDLFLAIGTNATANIGIWSGFGGQHYYVAGLFGGLFGQSTLRHDGTLEGGMYANPAYPYVWFYSGSGPGNTRAVVTLGVRVP